MIGEEEDDEETILSLSLCLPGDVVCSWGRGEDGQLGHGDAEDRSSPTQLSALDEHQIVSVTCGADHTVTYSQSRLEVYSWGWGDFGRLGHGNSSDLFTPLPIKALHGVRIKQIACGDNHCLAVTMEGEVQSWGRNQNGQLGLGNTEDSLVPQKIQAFEGVRIKMVAAGAEHTAAVTEDGDLYGWGWGRYGNFGLGDRNDRLVPERVTSASVRSYQTLVLYFLETPAICLNLHLKFGHGDLEDHLVPHKLEALGNSVISQECIEHKLSSAHSLEFAFRGTNGQLGIGESLDRNSPKIIEALSVDGASGQHIESSNFDPSSGKSWVSPSERYAVVPGETGQTDSTSKGNGGDISVPQTDAKRVRL
ncbi:hypothetical protein Bca101_052264 [Brassica carinata]